MIVLLGEVGGIEEYDVCAALTDGRITKPLVAWCIGTCASEHMFYSSAVMSRYRTIDDDFNILEIVVIVFSFIGRI